MSNHRVIEEYFRFFGYVSFLVYFSFSSSLKDTNNGSEYESACHVDGVVCPKRDPDARNDARQATLSAQVRDRTL